MAIHHPRAPPREEETMSNGNSPMTSTRRGRVVVATLGLALALIVTAASGLQAQQDADEKAIRDAVARWDAENRVPQTADAIFWSGAYKRPAVRGQSTSELTARSQAAKRESSKQVTTIRRIEISQSRDMAYEFSDGEVVARELDASGKMGDRRFTNSWLRVWKKVNGQWQVAAAFARPHTE
jgi:hypothetical protein